MTHQIEIEVKVISKEWLASQVRESKAGKNTPLPLRQLVLLVVHRALTAHYGGNYSIRCLQASHATQYLLSKLGIVSRIVEGDFCCASAYASIPDAIVWSGFWDKDHHYWVYTEFAEVVDLTIRQSHKHPAKPRKDGFEVPAFWWTVSDGLPPTIHYLPRGVVAAEANYETAEVGYDVERLLRVLDECWTDQLQRLKPRQISFGPLLTGRESWEQLRKAENTWVLVNCLAATTNDPLPPWIAKRNDDLLAMWRDNEAGLSP